MDPANTGIPYRSPRKGTRSPGKPPFIASETRALTRAPKLLGGSGGLSKVVKNPNYSYSGPNYPHY